VRFDTDAVKPAGVEGACVSACASTKSLAPADALWVVLAGGILGIIAMRLVVGRLLVLIERYPALVDGAFIIIAWVGIKLLVEYLHAEHFIGFEVPQWASLGLIVMIFIASLIYARREAATNHVRNLEGISPEETAHVLSNSDV